MLARTVAQCLSQLSEFYSWMLYHMFAVTFIEDVRLRGGGGCHRTENAVDQRKPNALSQLVISARLQQHWLSKFSGADSSS
eukprot:5293272-Amphidinium_carterae.1